MPWHYSVKYFIGFRRIPKHGGCQIEISQFLIYMNKKEILKAEGHTLQKNYS